VGIADAAYLQSRLGTATGATASTGDLTGDGAVDRADAAALASRYGRGAPPASGGSAPAAIVAQVRQQRDRDAAQADHESLAAALDRRTIARRRPLAGRFVDRAMAESAAPFAARDADPSSVALRAARVRRLRQ
jgi:hypothetical protein